MKPDSFRDFVLDQLSDVGGVMCRSMFGAYGLYSHGRFFAIIHKGKLFFKTDDKSRDSYIEKGMKPFRPSNKQTLKNYYEVPADVIDEPGLLAEWAVKAASIKK